MNPPTLTLYVLAGCPYCAKVLETGEDLGIVFDIRDIDDPGVSEELEARGGKVQAPYLVYEEKGVEMYESEPIIDYLHERFGKDGVE